MNGKTKSKEYIIRISQDDYTKDMKRMFDYLRCKKVTSHSKATLKEIDKLVNDVQKNRNEKKQATQFV